MLKATQLVLNVGWLQAAKGFALGHIDMVAGLGSMKAIRTTHPNSLASGKVKREVPKESDGLSTVFTERLLRFLSSVKILNIFL